LKELLGIILFLQQRNNYHLKKNKTIRQFISIALLLLFVVNITPKKTLHLLFGCHKEISNTLAANNSDQVSIKSFHCSCNQADMQTAFEEPSIVLTTVARIYAIEITAQYETILYSQPASSSRLRGPPVAFHS
jgi:hypothetical protein